MKIDLGRYRGKNSRVFSGREEGKRVRHQLGIDKYDSKQQPVTIVIPEDTLSFNTSFFLGMFGNSIRSLGEEAFRNVYSFECKPIIQKSIEDGITRALKRSQPLGE